jgi:NADPH:quinone reductase-like Zn-dependent oxidoreductase
MIDLGYLLNGGPGRLALGSNRPTMKAVVTTGNGGYDKLDYRDVPIPVPEPGEVLLRVLAAGVNNTEVNTRLGWYSSSVTSGTNQYSEREDTPDLPDGGWNEATPFPLIQGTDCCGEVVARGEGVSSPEIGARVLVRACMRSRGFGSLDNIWMGSDFDGAFAEYVKVPACEAFTVDCDWTNEELATIPCAYGTAENMVHRANIGPSDRVLVTGASGGVGSAVVQLARRRGATVIAVCAKSKVDAVKGIGASAVILRGTDLREEPGESGVDVVVDNVAGAGFEHLLKVLVRGGRYVSSGAIAGPIVTMDMRDFYLKDLNLVGCTAWDQPVFPNLVGYLERREIRPLVAKVFPLSDIAIAQEEFLQKTHVGNFVLVPPGDVYE